MNTDIPKSFYQKIVTVPEGERTAWRIIGWWELRRILYNAILLITGVIETVLFFVVANDPIRFLPPPFFALMGFMLYVGAANFCYTFGWVFELFLNKLLHIKTNGFAKYSFIIGCIFAVFVNILPGILYGITYIKEGEISSPFYHYTITEPVINDLTGIYRLTSTGQHYSKYDSLMRNEARLVIYNDHRFEMGPIPVSYDIDFINEDTLFQIKHLFDYYAVFDFGVKIVKLSGTWNLEKNYNHEYGIVLTVDAVNETDFSEIEFFECHSLFIHLKQEKAPYQLFYPFGDPDSWTYAQFEKIEIDSSVNKHN